LNEVRKFIQELDEKFSRETEILKEKKRSVRCEKLNKSNKKQWEASSIN
jgi:hypothetical protein